MMMKQGWVFEEQMFVNGWVWASKMFLKGLVLKRTMFLKASVKPRMFVQGSNFPKFYTKCILLVTMMLIKGPVINYVRG